MNLRVGHSRLAAAVLLPLLVVVLACRPVPPAPKEPAVAPTVAPVAKDAQPKVSEPPATDPRQAAPKVAADAAVKTGGIAIIAHREDPPASWDPMFQTSISLAHVAGSVNGDGVLVRPCREDIYKVCPALAESWSNNPEFTFKLRDGVLWHDGTPLTAEDIRWWVDLAYNGVKVGDKSRPASRFKAYFGDLASVEAPDPRTVRFAMKNPTPYFLDLIASRNVVLAHPRYLMDPKIKAGEVMVSPADVGYVSVGPFKVDKVEKGSVVQVRKFDKYWEKDAQGKPLPYLDGIDFPIINDLSAVVAAFRSGRLDGGTRGLGFTLKPEQKDSLKQALGEGVWFAELGGQRETLWFNTLRDTPLKDVRVRKAVSLAINKREGILAVESGNAFLSTLQNPKSPWPNPEWLTWPGYNESTIVQDRAEAKRLLAEAGLENGFETTLFGQRSWQAEHEWLQGQLATVGIKASLDLVDVATYNERAARKDFNLQTGKGATITFPEGLSVLINQLSLANNAFAVHEDPKVAEFFTRFDKAKTLEERVPIYREMEKYVLQDQVYGVVLYDQIQTIPYRSHVKGMMLPAEDITANLSFATVWLDK
ncbi:MAG: ABC transporter substrate-binding protein [Chloroflexota bacterium]